MKKWFTVLLASFLLLSALPPAAVSAAAGGELAVQGRNITVTLHKPEGETRAVTSLRFWMYVEITEGDMEQPEFRFTDSTADGGIPGIVKDAAVSRQGSRYAVDLIVSAKNDQDIFRGGSQAVIGTLVMYPASQTVKAEIGVAGEGAAEGSQPVLRYVSSAGQSEEAVFLSGVKPVIYSGSAADIPQTPGGESGADFHKDTEPKLKLNVKNTTRRVDFSWKQIPGADGYKIYQYQEDTGKYKRIKTVSKGDRTSYTRKMDPGTSYSFRMRAFKNGQDGSKTYGVYSAAKQITTAPGKVRGLAVRKQKNAGPALVWTQVRPADGYQIFCSQDKEGVYSRIKTVKKGDICRYSIKKQTGNKAFYKVRAYVVRTNGKRKYGAFSSIKKVYVRSFRIEKRREGREISDGYLCGSG